MQRAFLEVVLLGIAGGLLGCWVIQYELSYSAESLAHALLPGLVLSALTGLPLLLGGAAGLAAAALAVALAGRIPELGRDTAVAVVVTAMLGLGVLLALSPDAPPRLQDLLFGDVLGVSDTDLLLAGVLVLGAVLALVLLHGRLLAVGFDRLSASALGVRPLAVDAALLLLLAVVLLVAVQGLGNLLVISILIAPATAARAVGRRMAPMMLASAAVAVVGGIAGLYVSYYAETAAGASITACLVLLALGASAARALRRVTVARPRAV
ncbi:metal ABC transporter permease [Conexibacter sp. W3-3-2]|uniref:Metal ABC transporter permease n=2 Tax=Thermoleophilia TaxID=1497346 RepID=A0A2T4UNP4_9ACTN|nr:metal ABC transporter permease [Conexibacter sp. W3-3-2]PTL60834.1 metal ABC transporter permease [Paraconexibacter algicola]